MTFDDLQIWLIWGLVPYRIHKKHLPGGLRLIEVRALFWTFYIKQRPSGRHDWTLRIPLIEKLRQAVWMAVMHWKDNKLPDGEDME
ncbi:MAG: hypothetical protein ACRD4B_11075 [Acidobacteriota bacterium]